MREKNTYHVNFENTGIEFCASALALLVEDLRQIF